MKNDKHVLKPRYLSAPSFDFFKQLKSLNGNDISIVFFTHENLPKNFNYSFTGKIEKLTPEYVTLKKDCFEKTIPLNKIINIGDS